MIVRRTEGGWLAVTQADHARLAGELVALVRAPELAGSPRRAEILRAVAEHDNGWWEEDAAPRLDPATGGPLDFRALPDRPRAELWRRGVERRAPGEPYVAALIAGHALRLLRPGRDAPETTELVRELAARRVELLEAAGRSETEAGEDDRWLRLGDGLSLVALTGEPSLLGAEGWRIELDERDGGLELRTAPFPWAGATRFAIAARRLGAGPWRDAVELGGAWISAPRIRIELRIAPAAGPAGAGAGAQAGEAANDSR